ncbi:MAG: hypothetical protein V7739_05350 [Motiliproteus sp.]
MPVYVHFPRQLSPFLLSLCLCYTGLLSTQTVAAIQHWVDEKGQHHYSDHATPDSQHYRPANPIQKMPITEYPKLLPPAQRSAKTTPTRKAVAQKTAKDKAKTEKVCRGYETKIRRINGKLRHGHSNAQGNRWRQQRRNYQQLRYQRCHLR